MKALIYTGDKKRKFENPIFLLANNWWLKSLPLGKEGEKQIKEARKRKVEIFIFSLEKRWLKTCNLLLSFFLITFGKKKLRVKHLFEKTLWKKLPR